VTSCRQARGGVVVCERLFAMRAGSYDAPRFMRWSICFRCGGLWGARCGLTAMGGGLDGAAPLYDRLRARSADHALGIDAQRGDRVGTAGSVRGFEHSYECKQLAKARKQQSDNSHY